MTAQTYQEFVTAYAFAHGEERARRECPPYMRRVAAELRKMAEGASPEDAKACNRRADRMDPDLQEVSGAAA